MPFVLLYLVVEIVALVALGSWIGAGWTLLVLLAGSVLGLWLARREGVRAAQALTEAVRNRRVAHPELTDGLLVAAGGLLLFVPGLVTDLAGLLLVLPPTRALVRRRLVRAAERRTPGLRTARIRADGPIVDGDVVTTGPGGFGSSGSGSWTAPRAVRSAAGEGPAKGSGADRADGIVIDGSVVESGSIDDSHDREHGSR